MDKLKGFRIAAVSAIAISLAPVYASQKPAPPTMPTGAIPVEEAAALAEYRVLIANGRVNEADARIAQLLAQYPRNVSILALAIEAEIAKGGATKALNTYEAWLGGRSMEEPGVVRRIARAMLHEWARQVTDSVARAEALDALARDGDLNALAVMRGIAQTDTDSGLRMRVHLRNPQAVAQVVERMKTTRGSKIRDIDMLGNSGSSQAVAGLVEILKKDELPENRWAAAQALGRVGGPEAEVALKPALDDPHGIVRATAAGALFKLGNYAGINILAELAASDNSGIRRGAAELMQSRPDDQWKSLVRGLLSDPDPAIRLDAARMLAPHEPGLVRPVLGQLAFDDNPAIRESTELVMAKLPIAGLVDLRTIMRLGRPLARVRAADRVLEMTR